MVFLRASTIKYFDTFFTKYKKTLVALHKKQFNQENIKGSSCVQYDIGYYWAAAYLMALVKIDYDTHGGSFADYVTKYNLINVNKYLKCKKIRLDAFFEVFGLAEYATVLNGIGTMEVESTFKVSPFITQTSSSNPTINFIDELAAGNFCLNFLNTCESIDEPIELPRHYNEPTDPCDCNVGNWNFMVFSGGSIEALSGLCLFYQTIPTVNACGTRYVFQVQEKKAGETTYSTVYSNTTPAYQLSFRPDSSYKGIIICLDDFSQKVVEVDGGDLANQNYENFVFYKTSIKPVEKILTSADPDVVYDTTTFSLRLIYPFVHFFESQSPIVTGTFEYGDTFKTYFVELHYGGCTYTQALTIYCTVVPKPIISTTGYYCVTNGTVPQSASIDNAASFDTIVWYLNDNQVGTGDSYSGIDAGSVYAMCYKGSLVQKSDAVTFVEGAYVTEPSLAFVSPAVPMYKYNGIYYMSANVVGVTLRNINHASGYIYEWINNTPPTLNLYEYFVSTAGTYQAIITKGNTCGTITESIEVSTNNPFTTDDSLITTNESAMCAAIGELAVVKDKNDYTIPRYFATNVISTYNSGAISVGDGGTFSLTDGALSESKVFETNIEWYKDGVHIPALDGLKNIVVTEPGIYVYTAEGDSPLSDLFEGRCVIPFYITNVNFV